MPFKMPPGLRIPYDVDGTIGILKQGTSLGGNLYDMHPDGLKALNGLTGLGMRVTSDYWASVGNGEDYYTAYSGSGSGENGMAVTLIFPTPTRLRGLFYSYAGGAYATNRQNDGVLLQTSKNSTNAVDGDWSPVVQLRSVEIPTLPVSGSGQSGKDAITGATVNSGSYERYKEIRPYYRSLRAEDGVGIYDLSGAEYRNVKAIRIFPTLYVFPVPAAGWLYLHLYGEPDTEALGSDHLQAWRADQDMRLGGATLSWGDVPLGSSSDKAFRLKNQSSSSTANDISIYASSDLFAPSPLPASQFVFSIDGGTTWATTVTMGAIGPGTISPEILIRRVTTLDAPLGSWSPKVRFDVGSWS